MRFKNDLNSAYIELNKIMGREISIRFVMDQDFDFYYQLNKKDRLVRFSFEIYLYLITIVTIITWISVLILE